jgi:hypothetical protein
MEARLLYAEPSHLRGNIRPWPLLAQLCMQHQVTSRLGSYLAEDTARPHAWRLDVRAFEPMWDRLDERPLLMFKLCVRASVGSASGRGITVGLIGRYCCTTSGVPSSPGLRDGTFPAVRQAVRGVAGEQEGQHDQAKFWHDKGPQFWPKVIIITTIVIILVDVVVIIIIIIIITITIIIRLDAVFWG